MQTLIDLAKLGTVGASLAFLLLSYWLLAAERALKDPQGRPLPPRREVLRAIGQFRSSALVFLIVGAALEFFLSHGVGVADAATQLVFGDKLVKVRFSEWEFSPEQRLLGFAFDESRIETRSYVLPAIKDQFDIYVAVRQKGTTPPGRGSYPLVFGPYSFANQGRLNQALSGDQLTSLGNDCVEFVAFGVMKANGKIVDISIPFDMSKFDYPIKVFNTAGVCL